jgi:hypothetical protein
VVEALWYVGYRLTESDIDALAFIAEHRLVLPAHVAMLLGTSTESATARLRKLAKAGFVREEDVFRNQPPWRQITRRGLAAIGCDLPAPRRDLRSYEHDVGLAWLWLAARAGTFGPLDAVIGERRLRSHDGSLKLDPRPPDPSEPLGVRLGGAGPHGRERLHYPDLLLQTADGRRIALELELSPKGRVRLETILGGYGSDPRIDGVVYFVERPAVARSIQDAARRLGVSHLVHVQRVRSTGSRPSAARTRGVERAPETAR